MKELNVKYRTWFKGVPPRPIKLKIPGWAGQDFNHSDGSVPQPWHCPPFIHGSTYGFELIYPFETECHVRREGDKIIFEGDFSQENMWEDVVRGCRKPNDPPMLSFAPDHFGMTSSLDLEPPKGYVIRLEPHPRFFTDTSGTCPILVPGHIKRWWSKIFFVVFKSPKENENHIFRKGEPYGQVLFVPEKKNFKLIRMTPEEEEERIRRDKEVSYYGEAIANNNWRDHRGLKFNDKYKVLNNAYIRSGENGVDEVIKKSIKGGKKSKKINSIKLPRRFFKV